MVRIYHCAGTLALVTSIVACSAGKGPSDKSDGSTGGVGTVGTGGAATAAGGSVGTGGVIVAPGDDFGTGATTSTGGAGVVQSTNGGYQPLTAEQVAGIQSGQCAGDSSTVEPVAPILEFVVDVSNSMGQDVTGTDITPDAAAAGTKSKWEITKPALQAALQGLADDVAVGIQFYPSRDINQGGGGPGAPVATDCVSEATAFPIALLGAAGSAQRTTLQDAIENAQLFLGTPTEDAYNVSLENNLKPYESNGNKFIVLITDGAPANEGGCGPTTLGVSPDPIVAAVTAAKAEGIGTFVIGSPGSDTSMDQPPKDMRYWLSDAALAGGTGTPGCSSAGPNYCHFDMTSAPDFATALTAALAEISTAVANTCTFSTGDTATGGQVDPNSTAVILTGSDGTSQLVLPDNDGDCAQGGWTRSATNAVELCPSTCEMVKADVGAKLTMSVGCINITK